VGAPLENLAGRIPICSGIRTTKGGCVTAIGVLPLWPVRNSNVAFPRVNLDGCVILTSIRVCTMSLGPKEFHKPVKVLRKLLKNFQERPLPEPVHRLRRYTRRLESMLQALMLDRRRNERRLLEAIARLRKRAGKVRDIDVLVGSSAYCAPPEKTSAGFNCWSISVRYAFDVLVSSTTSCK